MDNEGSESPNSTVSELLHVEGVTKRFVGVTALSDVSLDVYPGEVHAVLGRNGAGKSTLLRIISGAEAADSGMVTLSGSRVQSVHDGRRLGIGMIHQELTVVPSLSVGENIFAGLLPTRFGVMVNRRAVVEQADRMLQDMGASFDARAMVRELSTPQRQLVEVAKARARSASLLVMDEPTSSLGREGAEEVLRIVREVARRGLGVLYVSHRLDEVLSIADRVTILRDGKVAGSGRASDFRVADIVQMMVGMGAGAKAGDHTVEGVALDGGAVSAEGQVLTAVPKGDGALTREVALEVEHLRVGGLVDDVSFSVGVGEIVGLAGLVGSGRTELARGIAGLDRVESGSVRMRGQVLRPGRSAAAVRAGLVYAPEERKSAGLFLDMSIAENVSIMCLEEAMRWGFLRPERERRIGESFVRTLSIRTTNARARVRTLSGGNQQKVVLAKQLASGAGVLLLDEPTRGVDVAAKTEIYGLMRDVAAQGKAVLFISSEFEELVGLCDRVIVLRRGRVACELGRSEVTLGSLMAAASSAG